MNRTAFHVITEARVVVEAPVDTREWWDTEKIAASAVAIAAAGGGDLGVDSDARPD